MLTHTCLSFARLFQGIAHAEHVITLNKGAASAHTHARMQRPGEELGCKHCDSSSGDADPDVMSSIDTGTDLIVISCLSFSKCLFVAVGSGAEHCYSQGHSSALTF